MNIQKMITEKDYRMLDKVSYSSLKTFDNSRLDFYKEFILKEKVDKKDGDDLIRGMVVECLLYEPHLFEEKFYVSCVGEIPKEGTNMHKFVKALFKKTKKFSERGVVGKDFQELMVDTYNEVGIKQPKVDKFISEFVESDAMQWYTEMRMEESKPVISIQMADAGERIVKSLKECKSFRAITEDVDDQTVQVLYQHIIQYEYCGLEMKSMVDQMIIYHRNKTIQPYDLKCTWNVEDFESNYLKNKYYIQAGLYNIALNNWKKEKGIEEYNVLPMKFIVCHSINSLQPLIYSLSHEDTMKAINGFTHRGKYYRGVHNIANDLAWALKYGIWNISPDNFGNGNQCKLEVKYE